MNPKSKRDEDEDDPFDVGEENLTTPLMIGGFGAIHEMNSERDLVLIPKTNNYDEFGGQQ